MDPLVPIALGASLVAGAIAAISGFGIGSVLTPVLATELDVRLAIGVVALPHLVATLVRFLLVRKSVDRDVLLGFGLASAIGGLAGAALQAVIQSLVLGIVFAGLLLFAGASGITGLAERMRFRGRAAALAGGAASGLLGGLVGNQGGIRAASLLGFDISRDSFVATATAVALIVDAVRIPVYLATQGPDIVRLAPLITLLAAGAVLGTFGGHRLRLRIPEHTFRRVVGVLLLGLGLYTLARVVAVSAASISPTRLL